MFYEALEHPAAAREAPLRDTLRKSLRGAPGPEADLIADALVALVARKREHFADDLRSIGKWDLQVKPDGTFTVWAEVQAPPQKKAN